MQKLRFCNYPTKEEFNLARAEGRVTDGDINWIEDTKEIYKGYDKYSKKEDKKNNILYVDKIVAKPTLRLPLNVSKGYSIAWAPQIPHNDAKVNYPLTVLKEILTFKLEYIPESGWTLVYKLIDNRYSDQDIQISIDNNTIDVTINNKFNCHIYPSNNVYFDICVRSDFSDNTANNLINNDPTIYFEWNLSLNTTSTNFIPCFHIYEQIESSPSTQWTDRLYTYTPASGFVYDWMYTSLYNKAVGNNGAITLFPSGNVVFNNLKSKCRRILNRCGNFSSKPWDSALQNVLYEYRRVTGNKYHLFWKCLYSKKRYRKKVSWKRVKIGSAEHSWMNLYDTIENSLINNDSTNKSDLYDKNISKYTLTSIYYRQPRSLSDNNSIDTTNVAKKCGKVKFVDIMIAKYLDTTNQIDFDDPNILKIRITKLRGLSVKNRYIFTYIK